MIIDFGDYLGFKTTFSFSYNQGFKTVPDVIGQSSVRVLGTDPTHRAGWGAVLGYIHVISGVGEPRWLVGIQHCHPDRCPVLKRAPAQETRVHDGVQDLHRKGIGAAALIVHPLKSKGEKSSVFSW